MSEPEPPDPGPPPPNNGGWVLIKNKDRMSPSEDFRGSDMGHDPLAIPTTSEVANELVLRASMTQSYSTGRLPRPRDLVLAYSIKNSI